MVTIISYIIVSLLFKECSKFIILGLIINLKKYFYEFVSFINTNIWGQGESIKRLTPCQIEVIREGRAFRVPFTIECWIVSWMQRIAWLLRKWWAGDDIWVHIYDIKKYEEEGGRREVVGMFMRCKYVYHIEQSKLYNAPANANVTELNTQHQKLQISLTDFGKPSAKIKTYYTKMPHLAISYSYIFSFCASPTLAFEDNSQSPACGLPLATPSLIPIRIPK